MKLIPILFSTPMVQAILSGNKSMTRRTMKPQPVLDNGFWQWAGAGWSENITQITPIPCHSMYNRCPYGLPGEVLWVRERFCNINKPDIDPEFVYFTETINAEDYDPKEWKWKPGIHMPFAACRIFLRVKEIRVERLNEITEDDALREGVDNWTFKDCATPQNFMDYSDKYGPPLLCATDSFETLWISINGSDSWNSNPWVWVISFERITDENEIAAIRKQWNERRAK